MPYFRIFAYAPHEDHKWKYAMYNAASPDEALQKYHDFNIVEGRIREYRSWIEASTSAPLTGQAVIERQNKQNILEGRAIVDGVCQGWSGAGTAVPVQEEVKVGPRKLPRIVLVHELRDKNTGLICNPDDAMAHVRVLCGGGAAKKGE